MFIFPVKNRTTRWALTEKQLKPVSFHPKEYIRCRIIGNYPTFNDAKKAAELRKKTLKESGLM